MKAAGGPAGVSALLLAATGAACILGAMAWDGKNPSLTFPNSSLSSTQSGQTTLLTCSSAETSVSELPQAGLCAEQVVRGLISPEKDPGH